MPKQCQYKGCVMNVWGGGYCLRHQWCRTDPKAPKPLNRNKPKTRQPKKLKKNDFGFSSQIDVFKKAWEKWDRDGKHYCWITSVPLDKYMGTHLELNMFAHVLRKGYYTKWKYNPDNIRLLHPEVHTLVDNFISDYWNKEFSIDGRIMIVDFQKWFNLQETLKQQYNEKNKI